MSSSPDTTTVPAWHDLIRGDAKTAWDALDRMGLTLARVHEEPPREQAADFRERFKKAADALILIIDDELYPPTEEEDDEDD